MERQPKQPPQEVRTRLEELTSEAELPQQHVCKEEEVPAEQHLCTSLEELKQELEAFVGTPTNDENDHSEAELRGLAWFLSLNCPTAENQEQRRDGLYCTQHSQSHLSLPEHSSDVSEIYKDSTCGAPFSQSSALNSQTEIHTLERQHECMACGKSFKDAKGLKRHILIHIKVFSCKICGKEFKCDKSLKCHARAHDNESQLSQPAGDSIVNAQERPQEPLSSSSSSSQDQEHPEPPQVKDEQEEVCTSQEELKQETEAFVLTPNIGEDDHSEPGQKSDPMLLSLNSDTAQSQDHREVEQYRLGERHNSTPMPETNCNISTPRKFFDCDICRKSFYSESRLNVHMSIHKVAGQSGIQKGKKPYSCPECGKDFSRKGFLKKHKRKHRGMKHYICTVCPKRFGESSEMMTHLLGHYRERPHLCKACGRDFNERPALASHVGSSHGEGQVSVPCSKAVSLYEAFKFTYQELASDQGKI